MLETAQIHPLRLRHPFPQLSAESFSRTRPKDPPHLGSQGHPHPMTGHCRGIKAHSSTPFQVYSAKLAQLQRSPKGLWQGSQEPEAFDGTPSQLYSFLPLILFPSLPPKAGYYPTHAPESICRQHGYLKDNELINWNQMHSSLLTCFFLFCMTNNFELWARGRLYSRKMILTGDKRILLNQVKNIQMLLFQTQLILQC